MLFENIPYQNSTNVDSSRKNVYIELGIFGEEVQVELGNEEEEVDIGK